VVKDIAIATSMENFINRIGFTVSPHARVAHGNDKSIAGDNHCRRNLARGTRNKAKARQRDCHLRTAPTSRISFHVRATSIFAHLE